MYIFSLLLFTLILYLFSYLHHSLPLSFLFIICLSVSLPPSIFLYFTSTFTLGLNEWCIYTRCSQCDVRDEMYSAWPWGFQRKYKHKLCGCWKRNISKSQKNDKSTWNQVTRSLFNWPSVSLSSTCIGWVKKLLGRNLFVYSLNN